MSLAAQPATSAPRRLDARLQDNARLFAIGVSRYDSFPDRPVRSATETALAWLVVALRMGVSPYTNPFMVEEAGNEDLLRARIQSAVDLADVTEDEREGLRRLLADLERENPMGWHVRRPVFAEILASLVYLGNHLEWNPACRVLLTWSGHGALRHGRLVLCPADTTISPATPTAAALRSVVDALAGGLRERARMQRDAAEPYAAAAALVEKMARLATTKHVLPEMLDVLRAPVRDMGVRYRPEVIVDLLRFLVRNLERLPAQPPTRGHAEFGNVISPVHLMLALGPHDSRVTLVLDACHSGGLGDGLQGATVGHDWLQAGLGARIISASQGAQLAAEGRIGDRRYSAGTWALTQVLSRWERVQDGPAYALGIRNGELVLRANLLLGALSFRQQISLHAPPAPAGRPNAADLPFFALDPGTPSVVDPDAAGDGIQLGSDTPTLTLWEIKQATTLRAVWLAVGEEAPEWTFTGSGQTRTYHRNKLYVFTNATHVSALAGQPFSVTMTGWNGQGSPPAAFTNPVNAFGNKPQTELIAVGDPAESAWDGPADPPGVFHFQLDANHKDVFVRWLAPYNGDNGKLEFITKAGFPFRPGDMAGSMSFTGASSPGFSGTSSHRVIPL